MTYLRERPEGLKCESVLEGLDLPGQPCSVTVTAFIHGIEVGHIQANWIVQCLRKDEKPEVKFVVTEPKFRRHGIAVALYEDCARFLASRGWKLYASDFQHENAQAVWNWFRANAPEHLGVENGRTFLSFLPRS